MVLEVRLAQLELEVQPDLRAGQPAQLELEGQPDRPAGQDLKERRVLMAA